MDILKYNSGSGVLKNWIIEESAFNAEFLGKCEAIFTQGNGYLGVRNALEERYTKEKRNMFASGTFNKATEGEVTELPNLPDITEISLYINGHRFNLEAGKIEAYSRRLNLKTGEVVRKVLWTSPQDDTVELKFRRFVSLSNEHIIGGALEITPINSDIDLTIISGINGEMTNSGASHFKGGTRRIHENKYLEYTAETTEGKLYIGVFSTHNISSDETSIEPVMKRRGVSLKHSVKVKKGEKLKFEKLSCVYTTRDMGYINNNLEEALEKVKSDGLSLLKDIENKGYKSLLAENNNSWEAYWNQVDIRINSRDPFDQLSIRFALYHLNIMANKKDNRVGIGAKALSGEGYKGHSFWDTEIFILPFYTFTLPEAARILLEYRYKNLYGARLKAKEYGYEGAMYPWESAWIDDGEVTPLTAGIDVVKGTPIDVLTGKLEHHITADIVYGLWQYYMTTGDKAFMEEYGYEVLFDTALFWSSRLEYNEVLDRYEINDVIGPDEYKEHIDNNAFTNYMAHHNMKLALKVMKELKESNEKLYDKLNRKLDLQYIHEKVSTVVDKLYLPKENEEGIIPQNDQFLNLKELDIRKYKESDEVMGIYLDYNPEQLNEYKVSKQGDLVMLMYLLGEHFSRESKLKNYKYYESYTLHDSSLSKCVHSIMAADLDLLQEAYSLYKGSATIDLGPYMKSSDEGIHSASIGGIWQSVVMGFGGVRVIGNTLNINPKLPPSWESLSYPLIWKGNKLNIHVDTKEISIENKGQEAVILMVDKRIVTVEGEGKEVMLVTGT
ncbi:glycoside hydrolase family 65 protein [Alloiococcus sp. CFN-8]|uniref:glycoside hydrolase family 65 protein n=1 Tax=Alloiococcus sp. CFN-8 TaxID=3416081 RepID=UPI003CF0FEFE